MYHIVKYQSASILRRNNSFYQTIDMKNKIIVRNMFISSLLILVNKHTPPSTREREPHTVVLMLVQLTSINIFLWRHTNVRTVKYFYIISKRRDLSYPWENHGTCISCLSLSLLVSRNIYFLSLFIPLCITEHAFLVFLYLSLYHGTCIPCLSLSLLVSRNMHS